jgi:hypothetical protein
LHALSRRNVSAHHAALYRNIVWYRYFSQHHSEPPTNPRVETITPSTGCHNLRSEHQQGRGRVVGFTSMFKVTVYVSIVPFVIHFKVVESRGRQLCGGPVPPTFCILPARYVSASHLFSVMMPPSAARNPSGKSVGHKSAVRKRCQTPSLPNFSPEGWSRIPSNAPHGAGTRAPWWL